MNHSALAAALTHDCNACSGLCCVALPFDAEQGFGYDKEAGSACRHLQTDFTCGIHATLIEQGFKGCTHYSCDGAGQRVTRSFGERNWRTAPEQATAMFQMFFALQGLHGLQKLLLTALQQLTDAEWQQRLEQQLQTLQTAAQQVEQQQSVDVEQHKVATYQLLRQLATAPAIVSLRQASVK